MSELVIVGPKSKDVAQKLLAAAEVAGLDASVVGTASKGFLVPQEVADIFNGADEKPAKKSAPKTKAKAEPKADEPEKEGAE